MEPSSSARDQDITGASDRRRFLRRAGVAAGVAWVAPSIVSLTPAAAQGSGSPCAPVVDFEAADPCATGAVFQMSVPQGCPGVTLQIFRSEDGGPFVSILCSGDVQALGLTIPATDGMTRQFRVDWVDVCDGSVFQSFFSLVYGGPGCQEAGAPVDRSGSAGEIVVTNADGTEERIPLD